MSKVERYSSKVRERAVRMLFEHEKDYESRWAALASVASKMGCTAETLSSHTRAKALWPWLHDYSWHPPRGSLGNKPPMTRIGLSMNNLLRLHN